MAGAVAPIAGDVVPATVPTGTLLGPATTAKPQPAGMMNGGGGGHGDHGGFHIATVPNPTDDTDDVGPAAAAVVGGLGPVIGAFPGTPLTSTAPSGLVSPAISTASSALTVSRATMMLPLASSLALSVSATAAAAAAATTTTIASLPAASAAPTDDEASDGQCRLLGPFALVVQLALGGLALLSLVYKRWHEKPRRTVKVWFFDVSKQVVGSVLVHVANVFLSMLTSGRFTIKPVVPTVTVSAGPTVRRAVDVVQGGLLGLALRQRAAATSTADNDGTYVPNPCSFYLLNLAIDTTLGIPILIYLVRLTTMIAGFTPLGQPPESIESGHYSTPPRAWWWVKQSFIYFVALMGMKVVVLVLFLIAPWLARVGDWALRWTEGNEELQIFFVMMLFPLIMNAFQYYVIDTYIKEKVGGSSARDGGEHMPLPQEDDDEHRRRSSSRRSSSSSDSDDDASSTSDAESLRMGRPRKKTPHDDAGNGILHRHHHQPPAEYDPDVDGDHEVVPGSRPSRRLDRNGSVNKTVPK